MQQRIQNNLYVHILQIDKNEISTLHSKLRYKEVKTFET